MKRNIIAKEEKIHQAIPQTGKLIRKYEPNNQAISRKVNELVNTGNWKCIGHNNIIYGESIKKIKEGDYWYHIIRKKKSKSWYL